MAKEGPPATKSDQQGELRPAAWPLDAQAEPLAARRRPVPCETAARRPGAF